MAKGAAMIGPRMATMLAFLLTDAPVAPADLQRSSPRRSRSQLQLRLGRRPHQHQRHGPILLGQGRPGPASPVTISVEFAGLQVRGGVCLPRSDDRRRWRRLDASDHYRRRGVCDPRAGADLARDGRRQSPGQDRHARRRPTGGGSSRPPVMRGSRSRSRALTLDQRRCRLPGRCPDRFPCTAGMAATLRANRDVDLRLLLSRGDARIRFWTWDLTAEYVRLNADYTT